MKDFSEMAGLRANVFKSNLFVAGADNVKENLLQLTGYQEGGFHFRYLDIPLASIKLKISDYSTLLDSLASKINSWPKHTLSHAGRLELIRTVLQGAQCYWMTILPFWAGVIKKIYTACCNFFWSSKHAPISWKQVCMPMKCGVLGLRNLYFWNKALLCKMLWKIHAKKDSLWIKWIHHYYFRDIWNYTAKRDDSNLVKSVVQLQDDLRANGEPIDRIQGRLMEWFEGPKASIELAYRWFIPNLMHWPWKPIVCKPDWLGMSKPMRSENSFLSALCGVYRGSNMNAKWRFSTIAATIYHIWEMRNRKFFYDETPDVSSITWKIK